VSACAVVVAGVTRNGTWGIGEIRTVVDVCNEATAMFAPITWIDRGSLKCKSQHLMIRRDDDRQSALVRIPNP
jgi:hypothetical protein